MLLAYIINGGGPGTNTRCLSFLRCVEGVSVSKLLSKLVASEHKPNLQTIVDPTVPGAIAQLFPRDRRVREIPGIGRKTSEILKTCFGGGQSVL